MNVELKESKLEPLERIYRNNILDIILNIFFILEIFLIDAIVLVYLII